jgi:hypothetical protein
MSAVAPTALLSAWVERFLMKKPELTAQQQQLLQEQIITPLTPGTLLHDFDAFLTFIAGHSLAATGKQHLLPLSSLDAINARMAHPLALQLKRPMQKSYPHINGLFLLARAAGLLRVRRQDDKSQLMLDTAALDQWHTLNPTEQYFTLFEAYLLHASQEMIGERGGWGSLSGLQVECMSAWRQIGDKGIKISPGKSQDGYIYNVWLHHYTLLEMFGLIRIKPGKPQAGKGWIIAEVGRTPFGEALMSAVLFEEANFLSRLLAGEEDDEEPRSPNHFNQYQELLQPYFPEWQRSFTLEDETTFTPGIFHFKVSLGKAWRRIAIPSEATLDDLSDAILESVDFDNDHLHMFEYKNRFGVTMSVNHYAMEEGPFSGEVRIGDLPLSPGDEMEYTFDFGDNWEFQVLLEEIAPPDKKMKRARILESHGKAPKQYGGWNEE